MWSRPSYDADSSDRNCQGRITVVRCVDRTGQQQQRLRWSFESKTSRESVLGSSKVCTLYLKANARAKGVQAIYYGMAMDHKTTLVIFTIWDSLLRAHDFIKAREYPEFVEAINRLCPEFPTITHTEIDNQWNELENVIYSPCIDVVPLKLKKDRVGAYYQNFKIGGKLIAAAPGNVAQFQNNQIEDPFTQWSLVAWEDMEVVHSLSEANL